MNSVSILIKGTPEPSCHFHHVTVQQEGSCEPGKQLIPDTESATALILDFQPPELQEINVCCLSHPTLWYFCYSSPDRQLSWTSLRSKGEQDGDVIYFSFEAWT